MQAGRAPDQRPLAEREAAPAAAAPKRGTAVIAWHGMGQQRPLETVETVARGLANEFAAQTGTAPATVTGRLVKLGGQTLWRAEMTLRAPAETSAPEGGEAPPAFEREVHVYEAYWAAHTQGVITLKETTLFLFSAAVAALRWAILPPRVLYRYLFQQWIEFPMKSGLALLYLVLFLAFLSLLLVNFVLTLTVSLKLIGMGGTSSGWPSTTLLNDLTVDLSGLAAAFGTTGLAFFWTYRREIPNQREARTSTPHPALGLILWGLLGLSLVVTLLTGALILYHLFVHTWLPPRPPMIDFSSSLPLLVLAGVIWALTIGGSAAVRWFLLEFVGDAAIYVSSHKLNRFFETRQKIKTSSLDVACAIYEHGNYERHVLMGHSLGSVIAYDTLNRLIVDDIVGGGTLQVLPRTSLLVTFGSILDKTAFIFRTQSIFNDVREALIAAGLPLISDYQQRPPWINIHSPHDPLSGPLDYYDLPDGQALRPIVNVTDEHAWIPLAAHVQYWSNRTLLLTVLKNV